MNRTSLSALLALLLWPGSLRSLADPAPENNSAPPTELEGDWRPISIRNGDDTVSAADLARFKFSFRGHRHTLTITTLTVHETRAELRVDPGKDPKEIDLELDEKPERERQPAILGIYELTADQLTIAYNRKQPKERLKSIPAKPEAGIEVVTLTRIPPQGTK